MGQWERKRLKDALEYDIICAFTREWNKKKDKKRYSQLLRSRNWYRDCHILPIKMIEGNKIVCEVIVMGRIDYNGEVTLTVRPRLDSRRKRHKIVLPADMRINMYDPSE